MAGQSLVSATNDGIPAVEFSNVTFAYGEVPVLENVSFTIKQGEVCCIVGPNGGGKTTILKLLLGLLRPNSGHIQVFGESPPRKSLWIGYVPQHLHYDPSFPITVLDVVLMGRLKPGLIGWYSRSDKDAARSILQQVGMEGKEEVTFASLSGGQRQRALIARALVSDPKLLLLDEPTSNVDLASEGRLQEILVALKSRMTCVLVTHDLAFVSSLSTSILCVNRRVLSHTSGELSEAVLHEMYGSDIRLVKHSTTHAQG